MALKFPKIKFNANAFGHTFVGRKATRWLQGNFDGLGRDRIIYIVQNNLVLIDLLPAEMKGHYTKLGRQYRELFPKFTDEEVYSWVPNYWREVIEGIDGGQEWGLRQVAIIRKIIMTG